MRLDKMQMEMIGENPQVWKQLKGDEKDDYL
jgi:hypothetical protein